MLRTTTPVFLVSDIAATIRWYEKNLQFEGGAFPEKPPHTFGILQKDGIEIMLQQLDGYQKPALYEKRNGGVWDAYVRMEGVREWYAIVSKLDEVKVLEPLQTMFYGETEFVIRDVNGYVLVFAERETQ